MGLFDSIGGVVGDIAGGVGTPIGQAIGGIAGGLGSGAAQTSYQASSPGLYDDEDRRKRFADALAGLNASNPAASPFRQGQTQLIGQLQQTARGQGPSVAQGMLNQAQDQNMQQSLAMAASARGGVNPALVQRNAMMSMAGNSQALAQQAATLKAQEAQSAQAQLANALAQGRSQDSDLSKFYDTAGLSAAQSNLNAQMQAQQINAGVATGNTQGRNQFAGGLLGGLAAGGAMLAASKGGMIPGKPAFSGDSRANDTVPAMLSPGEIVVPRTVVQAGPDRAASFVSAISKSKAQPELAPVSFGAILANQSQLHERLKKLEGKKRK